MNFPSGISVIYTNNSVTVRFGDGRLPLTSTSGQPTYNRIMDLLKDWNLDVYSADKAEVWIEKLRNAFDPSRVLQSALAEQSASVVYKDGQVLYNGIAVHNAVVDRIRAAAQAGLPITHLLNFLNNLQENPSFRSVQQLYGFLEKHKLPISPEGNFRAYKVVNADFKDCHTRTIDNSPGLFVSMPRNLVEDNPNVTCASGLHVCAYEYASGFFMGSGRIMLEVEINPRDVVSIPTDYNNAKMRVCKYQVIGVIEGDLPVLDNKLYTDAKAKVDSDGEYEGGGDAYDASWVISSKEDNDYEDDFEDTESFDPVLRRSY